ncbi:P-loop containing nucleoside triphosphate hydrolase protein [Colletotrichum acutatum]|uniref:P-loop containing nucleoside triphosphate hydrolase protein n=1 Tax=Glomerella acutata TaxID=27357 RepID=A0AAD8UDW8_GLOAC|nr:P-loop containing nucleoside triphosphate hydrolase protein [Colletotrichum acutatum]KAK1718138.1 P-loop containing nucleoside triphosphate hydrolase protein [Colletotrichum acutatum]
MLLPTAARRSATTATTAAFAPRLRFDVSESIPRSYYLGHHHAALREISSRLSDVGLVLECRDYRVPLTSWNPVLDRAIAGRERIVVYTHRDLGADSPASVEQALRRFHNGSGRSVTGGGGGTSTTRQRVVFWRKDDPATTKQLLSEIRSVARSVDSLTGMRALVVGMPNVGKSTLLNKLRVHGMHKKQSVAKVGAQPGVTRKLSSPVRILDSETSSAGVSNDSMGLGEGVFVLDTPGVFMPFVSEAESMVKLALAGSVKDDRIPMEILADYLLYRLNLVDPGAYARYSEPTNEVNEFLTGVARRTGKLKSGGEANADSAADWIVKQWRVGNLGKFVLDDITDEAFKDKELAREGQGPLSMNQARRKEKEARKERAMNKSKAI